MCDPSIPIPPSPTNYMDNLQVSFPEYNDDCRSLDSQGCLQNLPGPYLTKLPDWILNLASSRVLLIQNCQNALPKLVENTEYLSNLSGLVSFPAATVCPEYLSYPIFERTRSLHLVMEALLAFSLRNIMNSAIQYALSRASSSKTNHFHGTLSMSMLLRSGKSPIVLFEIVHCPCKASFPSKHQGGPGPNKKRQSVLSPYLDCRMHQGSSNGRQQLLDSVQTFAYSANASCKSLELIAHSQTNIQFTRKELTTTRSTRGLISLQDVEQHYGKTKKEAAESLQVSVSQRSAFRPSAERHRQKSVISAKKSNVSLRVAGEEQASTPLSPNAFPSAMQPFSSSSTAIETHPESSPCSSLSKHREGNPSHNFNMLENNETSKEYNMPRGRALAEESRQCKARNSLSVESLMPDALVKMSQPPQNGIPNEDSETSSMSRQKRKRLEKEKDCMNEVTRFEEKPSEIQNGNSKRQAIGFARKGSSCLSSISGTAEGNNKAYNRYSKSVTGYEHVDDMDSTCMGVPPKDDTNSTLVEGQPSLKSTSTWPLNSLSSGGNTAQNIKLHFDKLIALPLGDLVNPEKESSMMKALSILADNLSLFSEEQAKQILELWFDFPGLVNSWREYSQSQMYSQKSSAEMDKIRDLVETSVNDEESLKVSYEELEIMEKKLMAQLEAVQKEKASIAEQMHEKCRQTKYLLSLAEEKAASRTKEKHIMRIATAKLISLVDQWAKIQSFFM